MTYPPGTGDLRFEAIGGRTVVTRALATSPLKVLNPRNAGTAAWTYLASYGGGLLGGDALHLRLEVGPGAAAVVATQASTKVYRSDERASQQLRASLGSDSLLVLLPDPVACFAGSRYAQDQEIRLSAGAGLVLVDWLTAGRIAYGERWRFTDYTSRTRIWRGDRLIVHDALRLSDAGGDLARRMDRFDCVALVVLLGPALRPTAARLAGALGSAPLARRADLLISAAPIEDEGAMLRIAGRSAEQVGAALRQHLSVVSSLVGDDPWARKF